MFNYRSSALSPSSSILTSVLVLTASLSEGYDLSGIKLPLPRVSGRSRSCPSLLQCGVLHPYLRNVINVLQLIDEGLVSFDFTANSPVVIAFNIHLGSSSYDPACFSNLINYLIKSLSPKTTI